MGSWENTFSTQRNTWCCTWLYTLKVKELVWRRENKELEMWCPVWFLTSAHLSNFYVKVGVLIWFSPSESHKHCQMMIAHVLWAKHTYPFHLLPLLPRPEQGPENALREGWMSSNNLSEQVPFNSYLSLSFPLLFNQHSFPTLSRQKTLIWFLGLSNLWTLFAAKCSQKTESKIVCYSSLSHPWLES